jgi:hypothetical protein
MRNNTLAAQILPVMAVVATVFTAAPAIAGDWTETINVCAAAAESEGVVTAGEYRAKFLAGSGASTKTISIELRPEAGEAITAECKVRRGEVTEFTVKA